MQKNLKRILACVMVVIMTLTAVPLSGFVGLELPKLFETKASALSDGYFTYTVSDGEATINDCDTSISGDLVIPDTLGGYPVTSIGDEAFYNCSGLASVTIPDSVTSIGYEAFYNCSGLTSVTIPDSVTSIESFAFSDCTGLTSITIGNSVTDIGNQAFNNCTGLTQINWNAESVSDSWEHGNVFHNAGTAGDGIKVIFGDNVKSIPAYAFYGNDDSSYKPNIKSVTIGNNVTSIGNGAFSGCTGLTSITIPDSVTSIGVGAFADTEWYNEQPFGDVYAGKVYYEYKGTMLSNTSIVIKDGTKGIASSAFGFSSGLTSITIPDSVTSIGVGAFDWCTNLTSVNISDLVSWCKIEFESIHSNPLYYADDLYINGNLVTNITIPDSVTSIGNYAFSGYNLTNIIIPDSITSIGESAFYDCELTSVTIGNGVETISSGAFGGCPLATIKIGKNVKTIGKNAFNGIKNIPEVYYAGSEEDWKNIAIDQSNDMILCATMYYNADFSHTHSYTETITKPATCTEDGTKTFTCDCGKTYTETISATGHKSSSWITDKVATCTADGSKHKECTVCKEKLETATISATGHNFKTTTVAATCTSIGYVTKTCSKCGETQFVKSIPATGHSTKTAVVSPATESESGLSVTSCKTCGVITKATLIKRIASIKLSKTAYTYNGKAQTPSVVVKDTAGKTLKNGTDYTVKYSSGRKNPGQYTVTVTFKGSYSGKKNLTFTIAPKAPTLKVTAGSKKAALSWNKQTGATGYVVYMSTSQNGKYTKIATVKGNSTVSYTKTGLTKGKTYYFKVAAYTAAGSSTIYSAYSAVKSAKIK